MIMYIYTFSCIGINSDKINAPFLHLIRGLPLV